MGGDDGLNSNIVKPIIKILYNSNYKRNGTEDKFLRVALYRLRIKPPESYGGEYDDYEDYEEPEGPEEEDDFQESEDHKLLYDKLRNLSHAGQVEELKTHLLAYGDPYGCSIEAFTGVPEQKYSPLIEIVRFQRPVGIFYIEEEAYIGVNSIPLYNNLDVRGNREEIKSKVFTNLDEVLLARRN